MAEFTQIFFFIIGTIFSLSLAAFGLLSITEKQKRAARISFIGAILGAAFFILATSLPTSTRVALLLVITFLVGVFLILFFLPIGKIDIGNDIPSTRFDERRIMFARARLKPGTPEYESYYKLHPEDQDKDDRTRAKPGLLSLQSKFANPILFAAPNASFALTTALREAVDGTVADSKVSLTSTEMTAYIKELTRYYGALDVGVTLLKPYHIYSHTGRGLGVYGARIELEHKYAIALTVEMDHEMMGAAPHAPVVIESAKQYVESARAALQVAHVIRSLGYSARAHIDGNYQVIAPLVARDAGLGEFGRMSLLMTPNEGPRVRVGVVTTDLPLIVDTRKPDAATIDFCNICKKCAENCPSNSISFDEREETDGALRWRIDPDGCFAYWNVIGSDCGRCMTVCPFSHPNNAAHNLIRWGIARSGFFRRLALWMDDFFFGRKPAHRAAPSWTNIAMKP
ncbi:MAG: 4Fe-4S dicluster domain-containing protein [Anaerolineae bacterium]|jgi:ferredoxin|nr:4Fe-4S dicluster domain-containing protein [Anaerolineae bacterium]MBT7072872.1 4Fe-4S dicluster domain-containing protein [Anaerolineae bacterium]MBT7323585.1 4Fe-4S dicluster domain-containing protein [Anaerolineae bacterium]